MEMTGVRLTATDGRTARLRLVPRFAPPSRFVQRFVGFGASRPFVSADPPDTTPRRYAEVGLEALYRSNFKAWDDLAATGTFVMMGEFGAFRACPHDVALAWLEDNLRLLKERGWSWALWNWRGTFGVLDSNRTDVRYEDCDGHKLDRALLELLKRY